MALRRHLVALCFTAGALSACASSASSAGSSVPGVSRGSANLISSEELRATQAENLLRAIERLRPAMLSRRVPTGAGPSAPVVFVGSTLRGEIEELAQISVVDVEEVRYLDVAQAKLKLGRHLPAGVIQVVQATR